MRGQHVPVAVGRVGRRDGATSVAQAVPGTTVFVLREREVRTDAHLAYTTRLDVAVVWCDRVPYFVSHELRCDDGADFLWRMEIGLCVKATALRLSC